MRQNTCLIAVGSVFRGFAVSAAARPASSVPAKAKAALTNTLQRPLKPLWNAPGSFQYRFPIYVAPGPPPTFNTTPRMLVLRIRKDSWSNFRFHGRGGGGSGTENPHESHDGDRKSTRLNSS